MKLVNDVPMETYQTWGGIGSTALSWLAVSPRHYKHFTQHPPAATVAQERGTLVHLAALQPLVFDNTYVLEPDPSTVAPEAERPRSTKAYKDAVATLTASGRRVLRQEQFDGVCGMAASIHANKHAAAILRRKPAFELSGTWMHRGRICRGRFDILGDGVLADLKTTRSLRDFSPWTITRRGYYRQMGHYVAGLKALGVDVRHVFLIAVESSPPYDVGVFVLDETLVRVGMDEAEMLLARLDDCERSGVWPGQFEEIQVAQVTDKALLETADADVEVA